MTIAHLDSLEPFCNLAHKAKPPLVIRVTWRQRPGYMATRQWYRCRSVSGGGIVLGMGLHYFDLLAELSTDPVIRNAVIRTYRCPPNAPDTTSENYARVHISSSLFNAELILSAWKTRGSLPAECIRVVHARRKLLFKRQDGRDVRTELSTEFQYYRKAISKGDMHPRKEVMLKAHGLAGYSDDVAHSFRAYVDQHSEVSINNSEVC
jgi:predicted dehydrogenase